MDRDSLLPDPDVITTHSIEVAASLEKVWAELQRVDLRRSAIASALLIARGMRPVHGLDELTSHGFTLLEEQSPAHLALGLVGRFWRPRGAIRRIEADQFAGFDEPGYAKVVWSFELTQAADGVVQLSTETRVMCTDEPSRRAFRRYWTVVGPFSGVVRRQILKRVKRAAEAA